MQGEFALIARYFTRPVRRAALGVGDDCALLELAAGQQLAISTDTLNAGVHFFADADPTSLGHKALAVNLSDLAACGATPLAFTLALTLPGVDDAWLTAFSQGLWALAEQHAMDLIGGDTTRGPLAINITVLGSVANGQALLRSGAAVGDDVWVSGTLGDARLALGLLRQEWPPSVRLTQEQQRLTLERLHRPTPRLALGQALHGVASSVIDLSDGLLGDLTHVLVASQLAATLDVAQLPASAMLQAVPQELRQQCQLSGGDDYELLFSCPPAQRHRLAALSQQLQLPLTRIGTMTAWQPDRPRINLTGQVSAGAASWQSFAHF